MKASGDAPCNGEVPVTTEAQGADLSPIRMARVSGVTLPRKILTMNGSK